MEQATKAWVGETEASRMLGLTVGAIRSMGKAGRVKVRTTRGVKAMRRYSTADLAGVAEAMNAEPAIQDGRPINLNGRVADWTNQTFIGRLDACWMAMTAYGILTPDEGQAARARIMAIRDEARAGRKYLCAGAPSDTPLVDPRARPKHNPNYAAEGRS